MLWYPTKVELCSQVSFRISKIQNEEITMKYYSTSTTNVVFAWAGLSLGIEVVFIIEAVLSFEVVLSF